MSYIKRWLEDEIERLAEETGFAWDDLMDRCIELEFDLDRLRCEAMTASLVFGTGGQEIAEGVI